MNSEVENKKHGFFQAIRLVPAALFAYPLSEIIIRLWFNKSPVPSFTFYLGLAAIIAIIFTCIIGPKQPSIFAVFMFSFMLVSIGLLSNLLILHFEYPERQWYWSDIIVGTGTVSFLAVGYIWVRHYKEKFVKDNNPYS